VEKKKPNKDWRFPSKELEELLEERNETLVILDQDRKIRVLNKNSYTLLKYKYYHGSRIRFVVVPTEGVSTISLQETEREGNFECTFRGTTVIITDSQIQVAEAILDVQNNGKFDAIYVLWKLKYAERFLNMSFVTAQGNSPFELTREGKMLLPKSIVSLQILEWTERPDGGRVVKVELLRAKHSTVVDRIFMHEVWADGRTTRVVVNDTAVALVGRDETGQCWMHVVPPEFRSRSIASCEIWLSGGEEGKDELIDLLV
jgi:hypothetical protein